jgi:hypothetical protein
MGGLRHHALNGYRPAPPRRPCLPAPPGVRVLDNTCIAPCSKMLAKDGWLVKVLPLADPTEGSDFDTIIVSPDDYVAMTVRCA